jgi:hypothetical protein
MLTSQKFRIVFKSSHRFLILDIYKCPKWKTKSRIWILFVTEKKTVKNTVKKESIHGLATEILI